MKRIWLRVIPIVVGLGCVVVLGGGGIDGNHYAKSWSEDHATCKSTSEGDCVREGPCNFKVTIQYDCDYQNNSPCTPFTSTLNVAGKCKWIAVPPGGCWGCNCLKEQD